MVVIFVMPFLWVPLEFLFGSLAFHERGDVPISGAFEVLRRVMFDEFTWAHLAHPFAISKLPRRVRVFGTIGIDGDFSMPTSSEPSAQTLKPTDS